MQKYRKQRGPNLGLHEVTNAAGRAVTHTDCGGALVRFVGNSWQDAERTRERDLPGKIFCHDCGHQAGRGVVNLLRRDLGIENIYIGGDIAQELTLRCFDRPTDDPDSRDRDFFRYWEWTAKMEPLLPYERSLSKGALKKKKKRDSDSINKLLASVEASRTAAAELRVELISDDENQRWIITHPGANLKFSYDRFTAAQVVKVKKEVEKAPRHAGAGFLQKVVYKALGRGARTKDANPCTESPFKAWNPTPSPVNKAKYPPAEVWVDYKSDIDWIIVHPKITINLPRSEFNGDDVKNVWSELRKPAHKDRPKEYLLRVVMSTLGSVQVAENIKHH